MEAAVRRMTRVHLAPSEIITKQACAIATKMVNAWLYHAQARATA
jgi:hypothetical protein